MKLEAEGKPTVLITTVRFRGLAEEVATELGMPNARIVAVDHPLGGTDAETVLEWADAAVDETLRLITGS